MVRGFAARASVGTGIDVLCGRALCGSFGQSHYQGARRMKKRDMTEAILAAKADKGISWESIAAELGLSPVFVTSACLGQNSLLGEQAERLCSKLDLQPEVAQALQECPYKGSDWTIPTDPLVYRFYEILQVYGTTVKELVHEKFGDGIMSAIDYTMEVDRQEDPKGDRVVVTMSGKFLPYKRW